MQRLSHLSTPQPNTCTVGRPRPWHIQPQHMPTCRACRSAALAFSCWYRFRSAASKQARGSGSALPAAEETAAGRALLAAALAEAREAWEPAALLGREEAAGGGTPSWVRCSRIFRACCSLGLSLGEAERPHQLATYYS